MIKEIKIINSKAQYDIDLFNHLICEQRCSDLYFLKILNEKETVTEVNFVFRSLEEVNEFIKSKYSIKFVQENKKENEIDWFYPIRLGKSMKLEDKIKTIRKVNREKHREVARFAEELLVDMFKKIDKYSDENDIDPIVVFQIMKSMYYL